MNSNKLLIKLINHKAEHRLINIPDVSPSQPPDAAAFVIIIVFLTIVNVGVSCRLPVTSSIVSLQIERLLSPSSSPTLSSASPSRYQSIFSVESWYHSIFFRVSCRLCVVNAFVRPASACFGSSFSNKVVLFGGHSQGRSRCSVLVHFRQKTGA